MKQKMKKLNHDDLEKVVGGRQLIGMKNPVSGISREEAERVAATLGNGKDMGSWRTMSGDEYMKWWQSCNEKTEAGSDLGGIYSGVCGKNDDGIIK